MAKPNQPADPPMTSRHETHEWKTLDAKAPVFTCTRYWIDGGDPTASGPCPGVRMRPLATTLTPLAS